MTIIVKRSLKESPASEEKAVTSRVAAHICQKLPQGHPMFMASTDDEQDIIAYVDQLQHDEKLSLSVKNPPQSQFIQTLHPPVFDTQPKTASTLIALDALDFEAWLEPEADEEDHFFEDTLPAEPLFQPRFTSLTTH
ncbi:hypothetical protein ACQZV8_09275 [Magnetococcales bacterium HHB-1]